jgi:hypothetical protein
MYISSDFIWALSVVVQKSSPTLVSKETIVVRIGFEIVKKMMKDEE